MLSLLLAFTLLLTQSAQPQEVATIEGFVLKIGTTEPVARARVVLTRDGGGPAGSMTATTDGGGKFVLQNIQPGRYRLAVTRDGYVRGEFGQRGPAQPGTAISLVARQELKDVRIELTPTGAISGRIYDRYGDPVGNANVQALKYTYQDGRRVLNVVQSARTNDLGEYRLFWMQPGQYIISAVPSDNRFDGNTMMIDFAGGAPIMSAATAGMRLSGNLAQTLAAVTPPDTGETYLTVYYPGTTEAASASPVDLRPGANYTGVDLTVVDTRAVKIRGRVISNRASAGGSVALIPRGTVAAGTMTQRNAPVTAEGTFEFRGIAPGAYDLVATSGRQMITFSESASSNGGQTVTRNAFIVTGPGPNPGDPARPIPFPNANEPRMFGRVSIDVGTADLDNVTIQLQTGFTLQGRIALDGPSALDSNASANMRLLLRPEPMIPQLVALPSQIAANGTFSVSDLAPGDYRLTISGLPRGAYVKSAAIAGSELNNMLLRVDGEPRGALDILVGANPGSLDATVQNERQEAVTGVTVVLVPNGERRVRSELYRTATSDAAGRIHLDYVVPGDYKLFAWEIVENGAWQDPDFMRMYEERGRLVRITEGSRELADIRVIQLR